MARYSNERKEAVLSKLLPPYSLTVAELARQIRHLRGMRAARELFERQVA